MSHSRQTASGVTWVHYGDLYGLVHVLMPDGSFFDIPSADLLEFVAEAYLRPQLMSQIERLPWQQLLEGKR